MAHLIATRSRCIGQVVAISLAFASILVCAPVVDAAQSGAEKACRATIAKTYAKSIKAAQKVVVGCHKLRDLGKLPSSINCNELLAADFMLKASTAFADAEAAVLDACQPSGIPIATVLAEFVRCPAPFQTLDDGGATSGLDNFNELVSCLTAHGKDLIQETSSETLGNPDVPLSKPLAKCHGAVGKGVSKFVNTIIKERSKCQTDLDNAGADIGFVCALADPNGKISSTRNKTAATISKACAEASMLNFSVASLGGVARLGRGTGPLDSCAAIPDLPECVLDGAGGRAGGGLAAMLWELRGICPANGSYIVTTVPEGTDLDAGHTGLVHDMDPILGYRGARFTITCDPDCSSCATTAVTPDPEGCRCSNDASVTCDTNGDCAGECECFYGPPTPYNASGTPACTHSKINGTMVGDLQPSTGNVALLVPLAVRIYLGISQERPCPQCVSSVCQGGERNGLACSVDGVDETFGAVSYDCPPAVLANISGTGIRTDVDYTTASLSLPFAVPCDPPIGSLNCACSTCSLNNQVACNSDAECAAVAAGVCRVDGLHGGAARQPNACLDAICSATGGNEGACLGGPVDTYCDGWLRSNGAGILSCSSNADCQALDPVCPNGTCGACTLTRNRECFLDPIAAQGVAGETIVSVGCIGSATSGAVNAAIGWPGPYRIKQNLSTEIYCSDGVTAFVRPGGSNCP